MHVQSPAVRRPIPVATGSVRMNRVDQPSQTAARAAWVADCAHRLGELRPVANPASIASSAARLWVEVGRFDPVIAAEMEHESWF